MDHTHTKWLVERADRCVDEIRQHGERADYRMYAGLAHQLMQARPLELRAFVEAYPLDRAMVIAPLMVLAWRIVGNEFPGDAADRASREIYQLCDTDEWEHAVEAFSSK